MDEGEAGGADEATGGVEEEEEEVVLAAGEGLRWQAEQARRVTMPTVKTDAFMVGECTTARRANLGPAPIASVDVPINCVLFQRPHSSRFDSSDRSHTA